MESSQAASSVMMIRPDGFGFNPETAVSNSFQQAEGKDNTQGIRRQAKEEFEGLVSSLKSAGVEVITFDPIRKDETPDAVFPNNWVSFHPDGRVILYPMMAPSRRLERSLTHITSLENDYDFEVNEIIDLSYFEEEGHFLEGTGSMVIDYNQGIIYANHSPRTSEVVLNKVAEIFDYQVIQFNAADRQGIDIYHTNVLMCVGSAFAVICLDALPNRRSRLILEDSLCSQGQELVTISFDQMNHFAGNMMELQAANGDLILAMSTAAYQSLNTEQKQTLGKYCQLVHAPIDTIEKFGGGSVRCMLAGIFLAKRDYSSE